MTPFASAAPEPLPKDELQTMPRTAQPPEGAILVMAHPDDEALWASALLSRAARVVLVFEDIDSFPAWAEGRRRSLAEFPLPNVTSLRFREAEVLNGAAWPNPAETPYGLAVRPRPGTFRGFSARRYQEAFPKLVEALRPLLAEAPAVVTHNPWGEYGHEDHVQVFRAVERLRRELGFALWVTGYVSDKSYAFMLRHLAKLDCSAPELPTDPELGARLRDIYIRHGCWTWFDDYVWPRTERFLRWLEPGESPKQLPPGSLLPFVWIAWKPPKPLLRRLAGRAARLVR
jgi:LmbE family N-acetylglucosaminyl deacetylase